MTRVEVLLDENRTFPPPKEIVEQSNVKQWMDAHDIPDIESLYERSQDIEWFWGEVEKDLVDWYSPYDKVLDDSKKPFYHWFTNARYNIVHDALDRHIGTPTENKVAYIFESEQGNVTRLTYLDMYHEVNKLANGLKQLGVGKGDRVEIYMPMIPALPIAMLACAKIGAVHSVVFSGYSANALKDRIISSDAKTLITADGFWRKGKVINLKAEAEKGVEGTEVNNTIVYKWANCDVQMGEHDLWWHELTNDQPLECETEIMDSEDPLFILYTSGTTGKPKGVLHVHGGYAVGISFTLKWVFDLKPDDIWWCAADIGWITGHSYIVYAPLILGVTSLIYEGAPAHPQPNRLWEMIERHKVSVLFTSPTSIRMHMRFGEEWTRKNNMDSLRLLGSVGEPINPEAWIWYYENIGNKRCPIMDTWWQTETGSFVISPLPLSPTRPGSAGRPLPGFSALVLDHDGKPVINEGGNLVMNSPWPAMLRTLYHDSGRYEEHYYNKAGEFITGDIARIDSDGYFWVQGRGDDVLNVSGHRIGNSEVESALVSHPHVSEAAVVGRPDDLKGESITAFVVLKIGVDHNEELLQELRGHVAEEIGKIARPDTIYFVNDLPKTRSGKIMRRIVRLALISKEVGDISTLANPEAVHEIEIALQNNKKNHG
ncbi:MAG: Acetyl-coenzyme A synthetase [ANME-2 cluster archaeon]|nr:Acetyl-coenzyme A synthetase [ANME-2 cluster archaeon]